MNEILIRSATLDDIPDMLPLMAQLGYPCTQHEFETRFTSFMALEGYGVTVATLSNLIVGWIAWSSSRQFLADGPRIHIEGLIVDAQYRKKGVGKKLMTYVENGAKNNPPVLIDLISGIRRAPDGTHDFYKSLGYTNEGPMAEIYLRKEIF